MATHALHALPLAGWLATRLLPQTLATPAVPTAAVTFTVLVTLMFAQALAGRPFI